LKDAVFRGGEFTKSGGDGDCATYYEVSSSTPATLPGWHALGGLAAEEGTQLGEVSFLAHLDECEAHCDQNAGCHSVTYCSAWGGCFLKKGVLSGGEATKPGGEGECSTYFRVLLATAAVSTANSSNSTSLVVEHAAKQQRSWRGLGGLAANEGKQLGDVNFLAHPEECEARCDRSANCHSITYCSKWGGCFLKDAVFRGGELTKSGGDGDCTTYYEVPSSPPATFPGWHALGGLAAEEGVQLGEVAFSAHLDECEAHCDQNVGCHSVTYCAAWGGCFMKSGVLRGGEATKSGGEGECSTYFKAPLTVAVASANLRR